MKQVLFFFLYLVSLNVFCQNKITSYEFFDGSGNGYSFTKDSVFYHPVTPENSSSGEYSGGEPLAVSLAAKDYKQLKKSFSSLRKNTTIHIDKRIMTSGLLKSKGNDTVKSSFIIAPGKEMDAFQQKLNALLKKE